MNSAKLQKLFHIDEYNVYDSEIEIFLLKDGDEKTIFIDREKFLKWLDDEDRLKWIYDYTDSAGEHQQKTGEVPPELYFEETPFFQVESDLHDYIMANYKKYFQTPLDQIFQHAFSHI